MPYKAIFAVTLIILIVGLIGVGDQSNSFVSNLKNGSTTVDDNNSTYTKNIQTSSRKGDAKETTINQANFVNIPTTIPTDITKKIYQTGTTAVLPTATEILNTSNNLNASGKNTFQQSQNSELLIIEKPQEEKVVPGTIFIPFATKDCGLFCKK